MRDNGNEVSNGDENFFTRHVKGYFRFISKPINISIGLLTVGLNMILSNFIKPYGNLMDNVHTLKGLNLLKPLTKIGTSAIVGLIFFLALSLVIYSIYKIFRYCTLESHELLFRTVRDNEQVHSSVLQLNNNNFNSPNPVPIVAHHNRPDSPKSPLSEFEVLNNEDIKSFELK